MNLKNNIKNYLKIITDILPNFITLKKKKYYFKTYIKAVQV